MPKADGQRVAELERNFTVLRAVVGEQLDAIRQMAQMLDNLTRIVAAQMEVELKTGTKH